MKKALVLFGMLSFLPMCTFASINENETSSMKTLQAQGYSRATMEVVDWANYRNRNMNGKYVRFYQPKQNKMGRLYQRIKVYTDPVQDDGLFGDHHIEFSNTWLGNDTFYSSDRKGSVEFENL